MIQLLANYRRFIAVSLFGVIYLNLAFSVRAYGSEPVVNARNVNFTVQVSTELAANAQPLIIKKDGPATVPANEPDPVDQSDKQQEKPDIGGPGQPEMSSFQSVNSANMVDLFTGDFSYNLPLLDVGGYPVNIHYASGVSMDQEASWVGLGWNVNPGTIGRSMRGLPDDFNGEDSIIRRQNVAENKTVGVTLGGDIETKGSPLNLGISQGIFHNSYNGWGLEGGLNVSINSGQSAKGPLSGSLGITSNTQTGVDISPSLSVKLENEDNIFNGKSTIGSNYNSRSGISGLQMHTEVRSNGKYFAAGRGTTVGINSYLSFATPSYLPTITMPMTSSQFAFTGKAGPVAAAIFPNLYISGYVSRQFIRDSDRLQILPAFGYLNFSKASPGKVLLDFNREKDIPFNQKTTPHLAIPQYTYDLYSISGEGTGGMFRPYRSDVGFIYDHHVKTGSENTQISGDIGGGLFFHGGTDISNTSAITETGAWVVDNELLKNIRFTKNDSTYQAVYFRNPGEKTINNSSFYRDLGGDSLIRMDLLGLYKNKVTRAVSSFTKFSQSRPDQTVQVTKPIIKRERDKRTQVISYLNAYDASTFGLEKNLRSYKAGFNPILDCGNAYDTISRRDGRIRKAHHISEIDVLNADGRRYIYGLPVYNYRQKDVTFSVNQELNAANLARGLTAYQTGVDNSANNNNKGKDHYYNSDQTPAFAHSFLLTGLLSPDYVDVTGNGITEDDLGDGVKFNYSQVYGWKNGFYNWRTPGDAGKANYNEGLKTYNRDDKGTYLYGQKEVWYLHSVESKTMIAIFKTSKRADAKSVVNEDGGYDNAKRLQKLDSIELFVKADLILNGASARPVKTVHFEYDYTLCKNILGSVDTGKLTLKKLWFSYNGNNKGKLNPYTFSYNGLNPTYNSKTYDRWGNYKDPESNPGTTNKLNNLDFPYTVQDASLAGQYAAAWSLTEIKLPSGGRMEVTYESDDYGFVQNRRATQMFSIAGFARDSTATPDSLLYSGRTNDCDFLFVKASTPVNSKRDILNLYLKGIEKMYFKIGVIMPPPDKWGKGFELVPGYGEIENYGTVSGNPNRFWVKLKRVNGQGALTVAALQFLRLNIPSKAYPGSETGDNLTFGGAVNMLVQQFTQILTSLNSFNKDARTKNSCSKTIVNASFVRLTSPEYKKMGGGHRVRQIRILDNWTNMTARAGSAGLRESQYGQIYQYTSSTLVDGKLKTISSGVASYEPMVGGEENPFRTPIEYLEKATVLAPTNYSYTETPLGESFFPSPMVGYSKVRVRTINSKAKSANGWEESEFYTTKDFPTVTEFTPLDGKSKLTYNPKLKNFLRINAQNYLTLSQGFKIELNDMNGKMKAQASYPENDSLNAFHYTRNFYKVDNDRSYQGRLNNTVWAVDSTNGHINTNAQIGKEVELMVDVRQQVSNTFSASFSPNLDLVQFPPPVFVLPLPSKITLPQHEENRFRSIAVTKIVQRYGILDSVAVVDKGSLVSTKNLVYDGESGEVLLSRTNNEFNDFVYNFSYPAYWAYPGMGMAYKNIDAIYSHMIVSDGRVIRPNGSVFPVEKAFESGDEFIATGILRTGIGAPANGNDCNEDLYASSEFHKPIKLWAISGEKGKAKERGLILIDEKGFPYSARDVSLRVLRSGKRNMTDASVGGITSLASPVRDLGSGNFRIVIDSNTRVLNTTAAVFKDLWQVENTLYQFDSCYTITSNYVNIPFIPTGPAVLFRTAHRRLRHGMSDEQYPNIYSSYFMATSAKFNISGGSKNERFNIKSVLKFDLSRIPKTAVVTSATLSMPPVAPRLVWEGINYYKLDYFKTKDQAHYKNGNLYKTRTNSVTIKNVLGRWNLNTYFANLNPGAISYTIPETNDAVCIARSLSVTALAQRFVSAPDSNFGMVMDLLQLSTGDRNDQGSERTQTYCAPFRTATKGVFTDPDQLPPAPELPVPGACITCDSSTQLVVSYTVQKDTCVRICRNNINDTALNPYRWGVLGNWRMDRSYVYYFDRKDTNVLTATNIRTDGELKSFVPYWKLTDSTMVPSTDTIKWVWNSAISQYSRKGFEIENYDPLGRFNSGLYGYNQTLPVAVAQNAKYREILYDGFEDYGYASTRCDTTCPTPRSFDFRKGNSNVAVDGTQSHTGRYSFKVNSNVTSILTIPVIKNALDTAQIYVNVDSTPVYATVITGKGKGLLASYRCARSTSDLVTRLEGPLNHRYDTVTILPNCNPLLSPLLLGTNSAEWTGKIQPKYTDVYYLRITNNGSASITLNGTNQILRLTNLAGAKESRGIRLDAGKLYDIRINYPYFYRASGTIKFEWRSNQYQDLELVPLVNMYPPTMVTADSVGSVRKDIRTYCIKGDTVEPIKVKLPLLTVSKATRMNASGWVKVGNGDCINTDGTPLPDAELKITYNSGSVAVFLQKTGQPIEGWQRYEASFTIPDSALMTKMFWNLKSPSGQVTYFDDMRLLPFNSNMKSFVYDPVSLRLMAELDENNYATLYEYDDDGTLIRVKKETERGIKTIKETRSALFKRE